MRKKNHEWVVFRNPRNGMVRVQACLKCGVAKGLVMNKLHCIEVGKNEHRMRLSGWSPVQAAA